MITVEKRKRIPVRPAAYKREDLIAWYTERFGTDFRFLEEHLPPLVFRKEIDKLRQQVGLPLGKSSMENLDSLGQGPRRVM